MQRFACLHGVTSIYMK